MTELIILRGLPGSGKTTIAHEWIAASPTTRARVNRDDLRASMYGAEGVLDYAREQNITAAQQAQARALLDAGCDVVVDDTNLRLRFARAWVELGQDSGATVRVQDVPTDPDECVRRDKLRAEHGHRHVGEDVIRTVAQKFRAPWPVVPLTAAGSSARAYAPIAGTPSAVLVDIDGTVALLNGRSPYDGTLLHTDLPNEAVVRLVQDLRRGGEQIVFCSGREDIYQRATLEWLVRHEIGRPDDQLFMRAAGDTRRDAIIKQELFDAHIREQYTVRFVLDDRNQVVRMWRALGLTCLQVADGAF